MSIIAAHNVIGAPVFYGGAREFWRYRGQECILSGPYECVAGETRLYNPVDGTNRPIEWYYRNGIAPHVLTLAGVTEATIPFVKGYDALYRVTLDNGMSFVATKGHRVLTDSGWMPVSALSASLLSPRVCAAYRPQSSSELYQSVSLQGERHSIQTIPDYQLNCSAYSRQYGEQPHETEDSALAFAPSQDDVHGRNGAGRHSDDCGLLSEYNHLHQQCARLSNCGFSQATGAPCGWVYGGFDTLRDIPLTGCDSCQLPPQSRSGFYPPQAIESVNRDCVHTLSGASFDTPLRFDTVFNCTIKSVEFERYDRYFDLHVPGAEHYFAEGVFHHNTGKTLSALTKLHALLVKYPKSRAFITRQTYKSLLATALVTYENKVLPVHPDSPDSPIRKYGKSKPEFYEYPNGSHLLVVGMDNPDKILSGEFDFGYVNQAEETTLDAWEKLVARCTGRAGNAPYTQLMGDCNPGPPTHWILHRTTLKLFEQLHKHNPSLFDQQIQDWTAQGRRTIAVLSSLTGIRKARGYEGKWVAAEGTVYEFREIHRISRTAVPEIKRWYLSIDFGYTNPFVCQLWGVDADGRLYLWHEIYMTRRTVKAHVEAIRDMIGDRRISGIVADHDAEDRATLRENGFSTIAAKKDIRKGIQAMQERLKVQADGKPRLYVVEDACLEFDTTLYREYPGDLHPCCTEHEFAVYAFPPSKDGKSDKEEPLDIYNHGMDAARYMVMAVDIPRDGKSYQENPFY